MWPAWKVLTCLVTLMTTSHLSPTALPLEAGSTSTSVPKEDDRHMTLRDVVTLTAAFEADNASKNQQMESTTQWTKKDMLLSEGPQQQQKEKESRITNFQLSSDAAAELMPSDSATKFKANTSTTKNMLDTQDAIIKDTDSTAEKVDDGVNDSNAITGGLHTTQDKVTAKYPGSLTADGIDYKSPTGLGGVTVLPRNMALDDITSAIKTKGLPSVTKSALDVPDKRGTEASPPHPDVMTEDTWTASTKMRSFDNVVSPTAGRTSTVGKSQQDDIGTIINEYEEEGTVSWMSALPNKSDAVGSQGAILPNKREEVKHKGGGMSKEVNGLRVTDQANQTTPDAFLPNNGKQSLLKCQEPGGCQSANEPVVGSSALPASSMTSHDLGVTLAIPEVTPNDLGPVNEVTQGKGVLGIDIAVSLTTDKAVQSAGDEGSAFGEQVEATKHLIASDADHDTSTSTDASSDTKQGVTTASLSHSKGSGHFEKGQGSSNMAGSNMAVSSTASSSTQPPIESMESDYVSIEEARSMTNNTEAGEMPSVLKEPMADKSTARPNKDATKSVFPETSMSYLSILPTRVTDDIPVKQEPVKSINSDHLRSFKNLTMQHARDDVTINSTGSVNYPPYDYDQDYDYVSEDTKDKNTTIEYEKDPTEGTNRKYNMDINRTKQKIDASVVTDDDVTQMSKEEASTTDQHRPLFKQADKHRDREVFKPQPHIANHHKRVYPPHAFHGLIWEDRRYLVSVLVPVGCGVAGALVIVCLAYAARSCQSRRIKKPSNPAPELTAADIAYMDKLMLLADSSDEDV